MLPGDVYPILVPAYFKGIPSSLVFIFTSSTASAGSVALGLRNCHAIHTSNAAAIHLPGFTSRAFAKCVPSIRRLHEGASSTSISPRWSKNCCHPEKRASDANIITHQHSTLKDLWLVNSPLDSVEVMASTRMASTT